MSDEVFRQDLADENGLQPGGPFLIRMLFKEPVPMPEKGDMTAVMERHIEPVECFCHDEKTAGFAALEHIAEFKDGKAPETIDEMKRSQMWDCLEDRERRLRRRL